MILPSVIWIGFDPREAAAFAVARASVCANLPCPIPVKGVVLDELKNAGEYRRPTERRLGRMIDVLSRTEDYNGECSTEFAVSRFFVPSMTEKLRASLFAEKVGWSIFMDCDVMARRGLSSLFDELDDSKAMMCVKHNHDPSSAVKMDNQVQTRYSRKNWSSVMAFNGNHPANKRLTTEMVNTLPGRDLHAFCWLKDDEIGDLPVAWNWLVGHSPAWVDPAIVHFTDGIPLFSGFENVPDADEWRGWLNRWAL